MKAPAVVFVEPGRIEIREMELPPVGPEQVGIRTVVLRESAKAPSGGR